MLFLAMFAAVLSALFMAIVMANDRVFLSGTTPVLSNSMEALVISSTIPALSLVWAVNGTGIPSIPLIYTIGAFLVGTFWQVSNGAYFMATKVTGDFGEVTAWDGSSPAWIAILGIPFGITLIPRYWVGIVLMSGSLLAFRYAFKGRAETKSMKMYYGLLVVHVGALTATMFGFDLLLKHVGQEHYTSPYIPYLGGQAVGFFALLSKEVRHAFRIDAPRIRRFWWALMAGEVSYIISLSLMTWAMKSYPGAVVMALQGTYPLIIWGLGEVIRRKQFFYRFGDMAEAFPSKEGERWKKAVILCVNVFAHGLLMPQTTPKPMAVVRRIGSSVA